MDHVTIKGKNREEALDRALRELGIRREEAHIEILDEGSKGFLGLGKRGVTLRVAAGGTGRIVGELDPEKVARGLLEPLGIDYKIEASFDGETAHLKIRSRKDEGLLIGRRGQTLDAIKHLVQRILTAQAGRNIMVSLEVGDYRERRESGLIEKAEAVAEQVVEAGKSRSLEPMSAQDRRIVHMALAEKEGLRTYTVGEGSRRRVVVAPDDGEGRAVEEERPERRERSERPERSERREPAQRPEPRATREESVERETRREPASAYGEIPDPSFRSTSVTEMAGGERQQEGSVEESRRSRGPRRSGRGRSSSRRTRETSDRDNAPTDSSSRKSSPRESAPKESTPRESAPRDNSRRDAARREERARQAERGRGGEASQREKRRESPPRREKSPRDERARQAEHAREAEASPREEGRESPPRREESPVREAEPTVSPKPEIPKEDAAAKPFSSDLARAILGIDGKEGEAKPPARKRRTRR